MQRDSIRKAFDQQAASYDEQWRRLGPLNQALHLLMGSVFSDLPADARFLCVGAGTGAELRFLAGQFPQWRFTVVEPSPAMLEVCHDHADKAGFAERCSFHEGYLESLADSADFHGASALLVSQFILERETRIGFFRDIARRLRPGGMLVSSDLSFDTKSPAYEKLLETWFRMMRGADDISPGELERIRTAYGRDVAVLPPAEVEKMIESGGFQPPTPFYQAGLIRGWYAARSPQGH
ncbi:class I SAM-dependent methyltransferase [Microbulbifer halophilus]|uniref:Class I SAM-dependent methyltransferase n=1 Tax=Microbulbifer halophilus TaxID=453963 RepID=A0ABW5EG98_9GAMM|nr:class I SAM-dependent methyltransferase [Microbulbifer halophilus]MCW8127875.1 class I SAM-dependent methyltransferase [Microbulbifer halophilus]